MERELQRLLRDTAFEADPPDLDELRRDASKRRRRRRAALVGRAGVVVAALVAMVAVVSRIPGSPVIIGPAPSSPDASSTEQAQTGSAASGTWERLPEGPVDGRVFPAVVWTGEQLLLWGGEDTQDRGTATGARFDPQTGDWQETADGPLGPKTEHVAVWTGEEAIICCGRGSTGTAAYDPATDRWRPLADGPAVAFPVAVWTGDQMIVAGGVRGGGTSTSVETYLYDPAEDSWRQGADVPVVLERTASAVWTGEHMIVWSSSVGPARAYDPDADNWTALPPAPHDLVSASLAWSGSELFVAGLSLGTHERLLAAAYNPASRRWRDLDPGLPAPDGSEGDRSSQAAVWADDRLLVWTGYLGTELTDDGSLLLSYDPATDLWQHHPPAPVLGWRPDVVWTDHGLYVLDPQAYLHYAPDRELVP